MTTLDTDSASFATALGPVRAPLASLDEIWTGEFLLLWRRGTVETRIAPKARGPDVGYLWGRIDVLDGVATPSPLPTRFAARKSVVSGESVSVGVDFGVCRY